MCDWQPRVLRFRLISIWHGVGDTSIHNPIMPHKVCQIRILLIYPLLYVAFSICSNISGTTRYDLKISFLIIFFHFPDTERHVITNHDFWNTTSRKYQFQFNNTLSSTLQITSTPYSQMSAPTFLKDNLGCVWRISRSLIVF